VVTEHLVLVDDGGGRGHERDDLALVQVSARHPLRDDAGEPARGDREQGSEDGDDSVHARADPTDEINASY
jgi:hypothetical protein